jgi:hypothetical protein
MFGMVMNAVAKEVLKISWEHWAPISDQQFSVYNVLIPQLLVWLIMEDMELDEEDALTIMEKSREYGELGYSVIEV